MKRNIVIAYMLTALLAGCVEDDFLGEIFDGGDHAIRLGSGTQAMSRGDKTGAEAAADLNNSFVVYGAKYKDAAPTTANVVFDHYNVAYQGAPNSTTSNYSGWEYVGVTPVTTAKVTGFTPVPEQLIKYWDKNFDYYDFVAYSQGKGSATFTPVTMTNAGKAVSEGNQPVYSVSGTISNLTSAYIADMVHVEKEDYHRDYPVTPRFRSLNAKLRMAMYEVIPGYSVKDVRFYASGETTPTTTPCIYAASELIPVASGQVNVYYPYYSSDPARRNEAAYRVIAVEKTQNVTFGNLQYGSREGMEKEGNLYLGRSLPTATYTTTDHSYIDVLPQTTETTLTLKCDYTLVPIDDATEEIHITGATTTIPNIYSYWMPNYAYTYVFKLTDDNLHPITFDAIVVNDGYQETVTELAMPAITTYQKGNAYTTNNPPAYGVYDPVRPIYITVITTNGGLTTLTTDNSWLYKVDRGEGKTSPTYVVDEASVGDAATAADHTYTKDKGTDKESKLVLIPITPATAPETFTLGGTEIPAGDSPTGTKMTVANAKFIPQTGETYVYQFKMADAQYAPATASTLEKGVTYYEVLHYPSDGSIEHWTISAAMTANGDEPINGNLHKSVPTLSGTVTPNTLTKGVTYYTRTGDAEPYTYSDGFVADGTEVVGGATKYYTRSGEAESYTYTEFTTGTTLTAGEKYYYEYNGVIYRIEAEGYEGVSGTYTYYTTMTTNPYTMADDAKTLTAGKTYYTRTGDAEPYTYTPHTAVGDELIANYYSMIMPIQYIYKVIKVE